MPLAAEPVATDIDTESGVPKTRFAPGLSSTIDDVTTSVGNFLWPLPSGEPEVRPERYTTRQELGAGGMGRVILAHDTALQRPVAMKVLHTSTASDPAHRRIFSREAGIAGRLEHPNIVPLYDAGVDANGAPYLTMRYVEGVNLRSIIGRIRSGDPDTLRAWTIEARCRVVLQLLSALQLAHTRGVVHRDLKPENVMIGPVGEVFLVDWGIACAPEESATGDSNIGTPLYMSPEQYEGKALDARSDLYSLAVLFYELLTLAHPYGDARGEAIGALLRSNSPKIKAAEHVHARGRAAVPRSLSLIIEKGMEHARDARWLSASSMADAIQQYLAGVAPVVCSHTAYTRGLAGLGRALDAFPRTVIVVTFSILMLALVGAAEIAVVLMGVFAPP